MRFALIDTPFHRVQVCHCSVQQAYLHVVGAEVRRLVLHRRLCSKTPEDCTTILRFWLGAISVSNHFDACPLAALIARPSALADEHVPFLVSACLHQVLGQWIPLELDEGLLREDGRILLQGGKIWTSLTSFPLAGLPTAPAL